MAMGLLYTSKVKEKYLHNENETTTTPQHIHHTQYNFWLICMTDWLQVSLLTDWLTLDIDLTGLVFFDYVFFFVCMTHGMYIYHTTMEECISSL